MRSYAESVRIHIARDDGDTCAVETRSLLQPIHVGGRADVDIFVRPKCQMWDHRDPNNFVRNTAISDPYTLEDLLRPSPWTLTPRIQLGILSSHFEATLDWMQMRSTCLVHYVCSPRIPLDNELFQIWANFGKQRFDFSTKGCHMRIEH